MSLGIFEKFSETSSKSRSKFPPIELSRSSNYVFGEIEKILISENFRNIVANKEYMDIYAEKYGFELSIQVITVGIKTQINMSVYGEHKRGKTRKFLKNCYNLLKERLE